MAPFPVAWPIVGVVLAVVAALLPLRRALLQRSPAATWAIRTVHLAVPVLGALALGQDLQVLFAA